MWLTPLPLFQGVQPAAAGHRGAERPLRRCLPAAFPPLEGAARDHRRRWLLPQGFVCPGFPAPNFPWGNNNLRTPSSVFSAHPSPMPRAAMPKKSEHSQFNPHTEVFPQFFPIPVRQGVFFLPFCTPEGCCDGVGDTWGHSLLPRLARNHSLTPIHELLQRGLLSVEPMYPSEIGIQLALLGSSFAPPSLDSNLGGLRLALSFLCSLIPRKAGACPFPRAMSGHRMYWTLDTIQALLPSTFSPSDPSRAGIIHQKEAQAAAEIPGSLREPWPSASRLSLLPDPLHQHL